MIVAPCITLGAALFIMATMLLVEDEINYPAAGSGARGRSAAKRSAEASGGASISTGSVEQTTPAKRRITGFVSKQIEKCRKALAARVTTSPISQSSVNASGQCPPVVTFTAGEKFAHEAQVQLFQHLLDGIITEAEYNAYAERIRSGKHLRARCVTGSWLDRRAS